MASAVGINFSHGRPGISINRTFKHLTPEKPRRRNAAKTRKTRKKRTVIPQEGIESNMPEADDIMLAVG
ncbi:MAG: hypothetical protein NZ570_02975 [Candidatus Caldarchaeum sp.]|nr:hypothetical protein [Candidatus Caldarchaeum sp.]